MERVGCDYCGRDDPEPVYAVRDTNYGTPGEFCLVRCRTCGLVYLNPRPTWEAIADFYPVGRYDPFEALKSNVPPSPSAMQRQRAAWLSRVQPQRGRVLDVGCSDGRFLAAMRLHGWTCAGVEPVEAAAAYAREALGLNVLTGDLEAWPTTDRASLITLWDVLEHTHSPMAVLRRAHAIMTRPGWLAVSVPNWGSLERRLFGRRWIAIDAPRHLYHFSAGTLRAVLLKAGFEIRQLSATAPVMSLASNVLRAGGDWLWRRGQAPVAAGQEAADRTRPSRLRRGVIGATHTVLQPTNALINSLHLGANLTVLARPR